MTTLYFIVTTDLNYDQRMQRICSSLARAGYSVCLVGRRNQHSKPLTTKNYLQKRINTFFKKGKFFYLEYNLRVFFFLLFKKMDGICAIDLDTIIPSYYISVIKRIPRIYDAHELFCEMKEVVDRPNIYRFWKYIERKFVPSFHWAYTVNHLIAKELNRLYQIDFKIIRNVAAKKDDVDIQKKEKFILYQGAVNEGRCFETLIPSMKNVDAKLIICGEGNFLNQAIALSHQCQLSHKIKFMGNLLPDDLINITQRAYIGITLFDKQSKNNYWSLGNRFFDYLHAGTPQICVDYPLYNELNNLHEIAVLIPEPSIENISNAINCLLNQPETWNKLCQNSLKASNEWNWQKEETILIQFYNKIFGTTPTYSHS